MKPSEFKDLTPKLYDALEDRVRASGGSVKMRTLSPTTNVFLLDAGYLNSPVEAYELYNDGEKAEWRFRGNVKS